MKKYSIIITVVAVILAILSAVLYITLVKNNSDQPATSQEQTLDNQPVDGQEEQENLQLPFDKNQYSIDEPGSIWWIVNKDRPLPKDYMPGDLIAPDIKLRWDNKTAESMLVREVIKSDLEDFYNASVDAGFKLMMLNAYRSYETQSQLYNGYVKTYGEEEANRFSAKPGTSEHQTGLTFDFGRIDQKCELQQCLGDLPEGKWLAEHAHEYGFIIRYMQGKEDITGYMYEPWHFRFVGKELATELYNSGQTMEEYFGL